MFVKIPAVRFEMNETLGFGMKCIKYILFTINFVFLLIGVLIVSVATIVLVSYDNFDLFLHAYHLAPAQLAIAIGALILASCFIGSLGAFKGSTFLVNIYALLLVGLVTLEIVLAIIVLIFRFDISDGIRENMHTGMVNYNTDPSSKEAWDVTQEICCGINNPYEWAKHDIKGHVVKEGHHFYRVPYSCCSDSECGDIFRNGCLKIIESYVSQSLTIFLYITLGVIFTKIFAVIIARILAKAIREIKSERELQRQQQLQAIWDRLES